MKTTRWSLLIFAIVISNARPLDVRAQDACDGCLILNEPACVEQCKKHDTERKRERCKKNCTIEKCRKPCGYPEGEQDFDRPSQGLSQGDVDCDYCLRKTAAPACSKNCSGTADPPACAKKCAKRTCASYCGMPRPPRREQAPDGRTTQQKCAVCEQNAGGICARDCGGRNIACQVGCVKEKCLSTCRPDLF